MLWKAKAADLPGLVGDLTKFANELSAKVAKVYVNEALSAGSLDASSTVVPAAMDRVALGDYVAKEFDGPMRRCLKTKLVIFSGLKTDKLDDLEAMIGRGTIRWVFAAGSLAMALKKAAGELDGQTVSLGVDFVRTGMVVQIPEHYVSAPVWHSFLEERWVSRHA